MPVTDDEFDGLCDVVTAIALASITKDRLPELIEDLGNLHHVMPKNASQKRIMTHRFIALRLQQVLDDEASK